MKQNFYMGMYYENDYLVVKKKDGYAVIGDYGCIDHSVHISNITNLRPVTVLDISPGGLLDLFQYMEITSNPPDHIWGTRCDRKRRILSQLTPTPPPKNEVGKPCVTEPLGLGAVVKWNNALFIKVSQVDKYRWLHGATHHTWDYIKDFNPVLLSEGVEG